MIPAPGEAVLWLLRWNGWIPTVIRDGDVIRASAVMYETGQKHIVDGTDPFDTLCELAACVGIDLADG